MQELLWNQQPLVRARDYVVCLGRGAMIATTVETGAGTVGVTDHPTELK